MRTLKDLASNALSVAQGACNLCGIVQSWAEDILELRKMFPNASTEEINRHPINVLYAEQAFHLVGRSNESAYSEAHAKCVNLFHDPLSALPAEQVFHLKLKAENEAFT